MGQPMRSSVANSQGEVDTRFASLAAVLYRPYLDRWRRATNLEDRVRRTIAVALGADAPGPLLLEDHATKLLSAVSGPGERSFTRWVCRRVGRAYRDDLLVYTLRDMFSAGGYIRHRRSEKTKHQTATEPDLVIGWRDQDTQFVHPWVFLEVKLNAAVSGNYVYCARPPDRDYWHYESQIECYPHGCWLDPVDQHTQASFDAAGWLWIGPDRKVSHPDGPWGARALHHSVSEDPESEAAALATLAQARLVWRSASVSELADLFDELGKQLLAAHNFTINDVCVDAVTAACGYRTLALVYRTWQQRG